MRVPKHSWPNTFKGQGALFVAQCLQEMLADNVWESYRVHVLETLARLAEIEEVGTAVIAGTTPSRSLEPVIDEACWSLESDPVVKQILGENAWNYLRALKATKDISDKIKTSNNIRKIISPRYKSACENLIVEMYSNKYKRDKVRNLCRIYCSHLLHMDYGRKYIERIVREIFFLRSHKRVGDTLIKSFFKNFDNDVSKYDVLAICNAQFANIAQKIIGFSIYKRTNAIPPRFIRAFKTIRPLRGNKEVYIILSTYPTKDEEKAREFVEFALMTAGAILFSVSDWFRPEWRYNMYVIKEHARKGHIVGRPDVYLSRGRGRPRAAIGNEIEEISAKLLFRNFTQESRSRLLRSINTSSAAMRPINQENKLISLWAGLEVLLGEPPTHSSRISHYVKTIVPCICTRYIYRNIQAAYYDYRRSYSSLFEIIVNKEAYGSKSLEKFAAILCLDARQSLRNSLRKLLKDNPLGLYRFDTLVESFSSPKAVLKMIKDHETLVRWQIYRIYRARNNFVHAGYIPDYSDILLRNFNSYLENVIENIINFSSVYEDKDEIDQTIWDICIDYELLKGQIESERKPVTIKPELLNRLIS